MRGVGSFTVTQGEKNCDVPRGDGTVFMMRRSIYVLVKTSLEAFDILSTGDAVCISASAAITDTKRVVSITGAALPCHDETVKQMLLNQCSTNGHLSVNDPSFAAFQFVVQYVDFEDVPV